MPSYNPRLIEPKWQQYWEANKTFRAPDISSKPKYYILDMFPYPSGDGLHVGHPEGYTATDILARWRRMSGFNVLHPMGWDAFGLPAEQHAIATGTHPRVKTQQNINTFKRQIKSLGFSYDWDREIDTTDPNYFKWTQWIFLLLFDTWFDPEAKKGRPISELSIPPNVMQEGEGAVQRYRDEHRLAYQSEAPVNWCPALGTVLANEEVINGKSERGGHPVVRLPLRQWMLRITAYADRLLADLNQVRWPEPIKEMQRNWIGRSEGAEVSFPLATPGTEAVRSVREGAPAITVFTTRPDTLFGATYVVLAPEHPLVDQVTTAARRAEVQAYRDQATRKSELERTELTKRKTGVFTGGMAINPVTRGAVPIWVADYVLSTYGTGAIMAVPAHDQRDFEFACQFELPIKAVIRPPASWLKATDVYKACAELEKELDSSFASGGTPLSKKVEQTLSPRLAKVVHKAAALLQKHSGNLDSAVADLYVDHPNLFDEAYCDEGIAVRSELIDGLSTAEAKAKITDWLEKMGMGKRRVNTKLRDWLFSRQRYWGEPFPLLHLVDNGGKDTGQLIPLGPDQLPVQLPELADYKPSGKPEPPLGKATDWVNVAIGGQAYRRETNTMPQWAGSCWYYLRYLDPKNDRALCDPAKEKYWMPVDLYVGGAEHAVLHLLYARFWHKVLFDRGFVSTAEPFGQLVNQGMILGEMEFTGFKNGAAWVSAESVEVETAKDRESGMDYQRVKLGESEVEKHGEFFVLKASPGIRVDARAHKMSKARGNVINPDTVVGEFGADSLRLFEMFMGPLEATKPWSMQGVEGVYRFLSRVWRLAIDDVSELMTLNTAVQDIPADEETDRLVHQTIKRVSDDLEGMRFNTAISAMMELTNHLTKLNVRPKSALETLTLLLAPFAPHLAEELWQALGHPQTLAYHAWPQLDPAKLRSATIEIPVQINGKVRARITVAIDLDGDTLVKAAQDDPSVATHLAGKTIKKAIAVRNKMVNFVVT